jgi:hypothetical protein
VVAYHLEADLVALIHAGYIAFVVLGFILIIVGVAMDWRWIRDPYLRAVHLAAILLVYLEALIGVPCPLTTLEDRLRVLGADEPYPGYIISQSPIVVSAPYKMRSAPTSRRVSFAPCSAHITFASRKSFAIKWLSGTLPKRRIQSFTR